MASSIQRSGAILGPLLSLTPARATPIAPASEGPAAVIEPILTAPRPTPPPAPTAAPSGLRFSVPF